MRPILLTLLSLLFSLTTAAQDLRLMSYNIRHGSGLDRQLDLQRTAKVIEDYHPDFVALQEVDSCATRSHSVDQAAQLGILTLMHPTFAAAIPLQGGKYGVALLSKQRPLSVKRIPMPNQGEDRVLLICEFKDCIIACTHLSLNESDHDTSASLIINEAAQCTKPFIVMGDWNSHPDSPFISRMKQHFNFISNTKTPTFPADEPKETLDYIAVYKSTGPEPAVRKSFRVVEEKQASDHRPLVADIVLKTPAHRLMTTLPYLQNPQPDEMTIMFQTNTVCHAWVEYGTDSLHTSRARTLVAGQELCYDIENKITLSNLTPGQQYYYRICLVGLTHKRSYETHFGDTLRTPFYSFRTPSPSQTNFTALIFNDLHQVQEVYDTLLCIVKDIDYDFVIFNGDCLPEPVDRAHAIRMIHNIADPINGAQKPIIFLRGNHEIRNFYSAGMNSLICNPGNLTYGTFNWGDTRFVFLDLGEDKPDDSPVYAGLNDFTSLRQEQLTFLQQELKSRPFRRAARRILISHIPIFTNDDRYQPCTQLWGPLLQDQPFDLYCTAHVHQLHFATPPTSPTTYPIYRGGGPTLESCTVGILTKQGSTLNLRVLTPQGEPVNQDL